MKFITIGQTLILPFIHILCFYECSFFLNINFELSELELGVVVFVDGIEVVFVAALTLIGGMMSVSTKMAAMYVLVMHWCLFALLNKCREFYLL